MHQPPSSVLPETESPRHEPRRARAPWIERVAAWSARHRKTAILGWLMLVVAAFAVGQLMGQSNVPGNDPGGSGRAGSSTRAGLERALLEQA